MQEKFTTSEKNSVGTSERGFWDNLPRPFFALAPMADVTDTVFRRIIAKYSRHGEVGGGPDIFWTEFVSADGLASAGRDVLLRDFEYTANEHPIVAQIFSSNPENMKKVAGMCAELGFDGIDINMGCPDRGIEKQGAGASHMKNPALARAVIRAVKEGARGLPVSVKTRLGYNKNEIETWVPELLAEDIAALTMHGRTRKEMSLVPARWEDIALTAEIVRASGKNTLILGNGDVTSLADARHKANKYGLDGIMIGRGIFGNPWFFDEARAQAGVLPTLEEKFEVMLEHTKLFEKLLGDIKNFAIMKKHYKAYVNGFDGAKELRIDLMNSSDSVEIEKKVQEFLANREVLENTQ